MVNANQISKNTRIKVEELEFNLPEIPSFDPKYRRAPSRGFYLDEKDTKLALANALRYVHPKFHGQLKSEFLEELKTRGRIYGYRFRPNGAI
jgi:urocanate hydratase